MICVRPVAAANNDDEIVYLDLSGVIRVLDPGETDDSPLVQWTSPTSGWRNLALGDVNGDDDLEIVGVGTRSGISYLTIFDPVAVRNEENREQLINGIPWEQLYEIQLSGEPRLVAMGEFNLAQPGMEIVYSYAVPPDQRIVPDDFYRFVVLYGQGDGRTWTQQTTFDTGNEWTSMATGDIDNAGIDEIALADGVNGTLAVFRVGDGFERIFRNSSSERPWHGVVIGAFDLGQPQEMMAVREADFPLATSWAFRYSLEGWVDVYAEVFIPSPRFLFLADVTGNGDYEIVMLRRVAQELGARARIFVRDNGNEAFVFREATLDVDNGYRSGTGADVDGDGRDEIVIARDDRIRIYTGPEDSTAAQDFVISVNSENLWSGNLNTNGLLGGPLLVVQPSQVSIELTTAATSSPIPISFQNAGTNDVIEYAVSLPNAPSWVSIDAASGRTPGTVNVTLNAIGLAPGSYSADLSIQPLQEGVVLPLENIPIALVVNSGVTVLPTQLVVTLFPCVDEQEPIVRPIAVEGTSGITFTVSIDGSPAWASVSPEEGTIPAILMATIDPSARSQNVHEADIKVAISGQPVTDSETVLPLLLLCAAHRLDLPYVLR